MFWFPQCRQEAFDAILRERMEPIHRMNNTMSRIHDGTADKRSSSMLRKSKKSMETEDPEAQVRASKKAKKALCIRYLSLVVLIAQFSSHVLVISYANRRPGRRDYLTSVVVLFNEIIKFCASCILYFISSRSFLKFLRGIRYHFAYNFLDTVKVGVPAVIYTIQNYLLYFALKHLDGTTYMVTYQSKALTTAVFSVILLRRRLSIVQWIALLIMIAGVVIVNLSKNLGSSTTRSLISNSSASFETLANYTTTLSPHIQVEPLTHRGFGVAAVVVACVLSGFAGVYFEKVLKDTNVSLWMRNLQLSALAIPVAVFSILLRDTKAIATNGLLQGFDGWVWTGVILQAIGGLVIAVVIKYADNILKSFASSLAIVVAAVMSIFIFNEIPRAIFIVGTALVIGSLVLYSYYPYRQKKRESHDARETDDIEKDEPQLRRLPSEAVLVEDVRHKPSRSSQHFDVPAPIIAG